MENYSKIILVLVLIGAGYLLVYKILPRVFKQYEVEKGAKLAILYAMMGYLCYDFYIKEKYIYIPILILGSVAFTMMVLSARRKE